MLQSSSWPPANLAVTKRMCRGTGIEPFAVPQEHVVDPGICASTGATSKSSTEPSRPIGIRPEDIGRRDDAAAAGPEVSSCREQ
jgi:hypothetical protein